jgi:hypothetical protein
MTAETRSSPVGTGVTSVPPPPRTGLWFSSRHSSVEVAGSPHYMQIIGARAAFLR